MHIPSEDIVYSQLTEQIRKKDSLLNPEEYYELLLEHGNMYVYDFDWQALDFKSQIQTILI